MQQDLGREKGKPVHCSADIPAGARMGTVPGRRSQWARAGWEGQVKVLVPCLFDPLSQPDGYSLPLLPEKVLTSNNPHSLQAWIRQGTHHWLQLPQVVELPPQQQKGSPGSAGMQVKAAPGDPQLFAEHTHFLDKRSCSGSQLMHSAGSVSTVAIPSC